LPFDGTAAGSTWTYQLLILSLRQLFLRTRQRGYSKRIIANNCGVSEIVTNVDASDLLINNSPAMIVRGGGTTYTFGFAQPSYGTVNISWWPYHGITDIASSPNPFY
jgi:hypothetical protein